MVVWAPFFCRLATFDFWQLIHFQNVAIPNPQRNLQNLLYSSQLHTTNHCEIIWCLIPRSSKLPHRQRLSIDFVGVIFAHDCAASIAPHLRRPTIPSAHISGEGRRGKVFCRLRLSRREVILTSSPTAKRERPQSTHRSPRKLPSFQARKLRSRYSRLFRAATTQSPVAGSPPDQAIPDTGSNTESLSACTYYLSISLDRTIHCISAKHVVVVYNCTRVAATT